MARKYMTTKKRTPYRRLTSNEKEKILDKRIVFEIQVEELTKGIFGYKILGFSNSFYTLGEVFDLFKRRESRVRKSKNFAKTKQGVKK